MRRMILWLGFFLVVTAGGNQALGGTLPRMWWGTNSSWQDQAVTTSPQTVISLQINKQSDSSVLKITFSGGRLSFTSVNGLNSQVVLIISLDNVNRAECLNFNSIPSFRNQYAMVSTIIENVTKGVHTISAKIAKTANQGDEGLLTYTTNIGQQINTYMAGLTVEEWPIPSGDLSGVNLLNLLKD